MAGKIGVGLLLIVVSTAFVLLILLDVLPMPGNISYKQDAVDLLALLFLTGTYTTLQGYRWAVNHKPKLDSDVVLMGMAAFISIFSFYNAIADLVLSLHINRQGTAHEPNDCNNDHLAIGGRLLISHTMTLNLLKGRHRKSGSGTHHRIMAAVVVSSWP